MRAGSPPSTLSQQLQQAVSSRARFQVHRLYTRVPPCLLLFDGLVCNRAGVSCHSGILCILWDGRAKEYGEMFLVRRLLPHSVFEYAPSGQIQRSAMVLRRLFAQVTQEAKGFAYVWGASAGHAGRLPPMPMSF